MGDKRFRESVEIRLKIPLQHAKLLVLWAEMKGTNRTTLSGNELQTRIESNEQQILEWTRRNAQDKGVPYDEYIESLYEKHNLYE